MLASILGLVPSLRHKFAYSAWAAVTVAVVADDRVEASIVTAFYRVQGTIAGSLFGYLTVVIFGVGVIDVIDASCVPLACLLLDRRWLKCSRVFLFIWQNCSLSISFAGILRGNHTMFRRVGCHVRLRSNHPKVYVRGECGRIQHRDHRVLCTDGTQR